jgi:hypothetical protein
MLEWGFFWIQSKLPNIAKHKLALYALKAECHDMKLDASQRRDGFTGGGRVMVGRHNPPFPDLRLLVCAVR